MSIIEKIKLKLIKFAQKRIDEAYLKHGLTDKVLKAQIRVNEMRNKYDINETDDEFVQ